MRRSPRPSVPIRTPELSTSPTVASCDWLGTANTPSISTYGAANATSASRAWLDRQEADAGLSRHHRVKESRAAVKQTNSTGTSSLVATSRAMSTVTPAGCAGEAGP
jgi:hypothetical protein